MLDAGALIAIDRNDRAMLARIRVAHQQGHELRTSAIVIAQVWRGQRQVMLARLLQAVDVRVIDEKVGRDAGVLLAKSSTSDPVDAALVLVARPGDWILTSDPSDIGRLVASSGKRRIDIVHC